MGQVMASKRAQQEWVPIESVLETYPWVREFSTRPGTIWGDVLQREQTVQGFTMLRVSEVHDFVSTVRQLARATARGLH